MDNRADCGSKRYSQGKPKSCEFCYFWEGKRKGCNQPQCYYLLPEEEPRRKTSAEGKTGIDCSGCSYGRYSPCVGYCLVKIMQELRVGRYEK